MAIHGKDAYSLFRQYGKQACFIAVPLSIVLIFFCGHKTFVGNIIYPFFILSGVLSVFAIAEKIGSNIRLSRMNTMIISKKDTAFFIFLCIQWSCHTQIGFFEIFYPNPVWVI